MKVVAQAAHCDEQTLAKMYAAAYGDHVLSCRYDISRDVILFDMYEHRPLTIEEIDAKRKAKAEAKEAERSRVAEEWMEKAPAAYQGRPGDSCLQRGSRCRKGFWVQYNGSVEEASERTQEMNLNLPEAVLTRFPHEKNVFDCWNRWWV